MKTFTKGDYILVDVGLKKPKLLKATDGKEGIEVVTRRDNAGEFAKPGRFAFKQKNILINFGEYVPPGKVYGVDVEVKHGKIETNICGDILLFLSISDAEKKILKNAFIKVFKRLKEMKLLKFNAEIEIRHQFSKMVGCYQFHPKAEKDVLVLYPNFKKITDKDLPYIISHESAHGIWYRHLHDQQKAEWIEAYHKHNEITEVSKKDLQNILEDIINTGSVRAFIKEVPDDANTVKHCLKFIKRTHGLDARHIELLLKARKDISDYWPTHVEFTEQEILVSEYGKKNAEEFFAESFSFWFSGKQLPKALLSLLHKTLPQTVKVK